MSRFSNLPNRLKAAYALPAFVLAFPTIPVFVLLPSYYGDTLGLGLTVVGSVFFALRLLDVISDPLLGILSDRLPNRYGKRRLPILVGAVLGAPALVFLLSPPEDVTIGYLALWGGLLYLSWTAIQIPYQAWAVDLAPDYDVRTKLNGAREGMGLLGILAVGAMSFALGDYPERTQLQIIAWGTVGCGLVAFFFLIRFVPERKVRQTPLNLKFPFGNKLFLRVLSAWFLNGLANGFPAVCLPLFLSYVLGAEGAERNGFLFVYFLFAVLGIPVWMWLAGKVGKHRTWCFSMILACLVFVWVPFLNAGDFLAFGIICALTGLALGSDLSLPPAIQGDCADWDRYRFKEERTGGLFAYWSMATKMALGVAVGIAFPVLGAFGVAEGEEQVTQAGETALVVIYALVPCVLKIMAVAMMWRFNLTQIKHKAVRRALEKQQ